MVSSKFRLASIRLFPLTVRNSSSLRDGICLLFLRLSYDCFYQQNEAEARAWTSEPWRGIVESPFVWAMRCHSKPEHILQGTNEETTQTARISVPAASQVSEASSGFWPNQAYKKQWPLLTSHWTERRLNKSHPIKCMYLTWREFRKLSACRRPGFTPGTTLSPALSAWAPPGAAPEQEAVPSCMCFR